MKKLVNEALEITKELGDVIFIGAIASYMHTKITRDSQDVDLVVENPISDDELISKDYHKSMTRKQPWFSPRGFKIDIFTGDISTLRFEDILNTAVTFPVGKKGSIRVMGLECLIISKHKAGREQDSEDLQNIAMRKIDQIDWDVVQAITQDNFLTSNIRRDMEFLSKN